MSRGKVRTMTMAGSNVHYLGELGPVSGLKYGFTVPGGCDQLECTLGISPVQRTDAMDPGRLVQVLYGASVVWEGILDEPQQVDEGWTIHAHGSGTWGADWLALYSGAWAGATTINTMVSGAISRGLKWVSSVNFSTLTDAWTRDEVDSGSSTLDSVLNTVCSMGGLTWYVRRGLDGNRLNVQSLPTTPNRLLAVTVPAPRTVGGDANAILIRYQNAPDRGEGAPATTATQWVTDTDSIAKHGRREVFIDVTSAGTILASDATNMGNLVLTRYKKANYAGPFTARYGQLMTIGGAPVDLALYWYQAAGPMVARLLLADQAWGGEVIPGPVSFLVGKYEYDDTIDQATITPFNYLQSDFGGYLAARAKILRGRAVVISGTKWRFK